MHLKTGGGPSRLDRRAASADERRAMISRPDNNGDGAKRAITSNSDATGSTNGTMSSRKKRTLSDAEHEEEARPTEKTTIQRTKGISATFGLLNFVCGMIGPGAFSIAASFKLAGLWAGFALLFLMALLSLISMHKIVKCSQYLATIIGDQTLDYGDMAYEACRHSFAKLRRHGTIAKWVVNGSLMAFQLGVLSVCFVFIADHITEIIQYFNHDSKVPLTEIEIMLIYFFPQLILSFIGNIKLITYLSMTGNVIIFTAIALIIQELFSQHRYNSSDLPWITDLNGVSMAAGALIYSFEGQAMVLPLENSLRHGEDMRGLTGVLSTAMNLVMLFYAFLGFFGYLTFGPNTLGSLTLNLPNNLISVIVKILLVLKVFFGSALQLYVIVEMLWPIISPKIERKWLLRLGPYILRAALTLFSLSLAVSVPNLVNIIPLVGITSGMMLSLILPSVLDSIVFLYELHKNGTRFRFYAKLIENTFLFVFGWFFLITGLQSTIQQLIHGS